MRNNLPNIWIVRVGDAVSQLLNVILIQGEPNESISGRAGRRVAVEGSTNWLWVATYHTVNFIFYPFQEDHCVSAYLSEITRAQRVLETLTA